VQYAIDSLKATVPIWKKEVYEEGNDEEWKENKECLWAKVAKEDSPPPSTERQKENKKESNLYVSSSDKPTNDIDPKYVQIAASNDEIERRIEAFIVRKRDEINTNNVLEFCSRHLVKDEPNEFSCARTDSTGLMRKKDSASHLRKSSVDNSKLVSNGKPHGTSSTQHTALPFGIEERVVNLEEHLNLKPIQRELYLRLKDIEDRVLYLEGLSPEYFESITKYPQMKEFARDENKGDPSNNSNESEMGRPSSDYDVDSMESKEIQMENTEYKEALSNSLCVINKRIQELQTRLRN
jgi:molybdopterin synthase catalytic subunit